MNSEADEVKDNHKVMEDTVSFHCSYIVHYPIS